MGLGKSVDCENPILNTGTSKAKWGLDVLFKKELNSSIDVIDSHSNQRIQILRYNCEIPLILVNIYLPSSSLPQTEYDTCLNQLSSIFEHFATEGAIFLAGDWNRSLFRKNPQDLKFQQFCKTHGLKTANGTDDLPSYHGYNQSTSRIDFILLHSDSCSTFGVSAKDVQITSHICKENNPHIISTHDAFLFEISIPIRTTESETRQVVPHSVTENKRLDWEKLKYEAIPEHC